MRPDMNPDMNNTNSCNRVQETLPWFINQTLTDEEQLAVRTHLNDCAACSAEAEWLAGIRSGMAADVADVEVPATGWSEPAEAAFEQLQGCIARERKRGERWQMLAAASMLLAVATLVGSMLTSYLLEPKFQTVTDPAAPATEVVRLELRFSSQAPLASLQEVMQASGAILLEGPDSNGRVILEMPLHAADRETPGEPSATLLEQALQELRANPAVLEARIAQTPSVQETASERE